MQAKKNLESAISLTRIPRTSLKQTAIARIRQAIDAGELQPGQQITEIGLARTLGVAQSTVREAFLVLEAQGFITRLSPRHTCITRLERRQVDEIYAVRRVLEHLAVELLAGVPSDSLTECRQAQREMVRAARNGGAGAFYTADLEFHRALWRATDNACLAGSLERIVPRLFAFGIIRHTHPRRSQLLGLAEVHGRLLDLISSGDKAAACRLMDDSMERAWTDDALSL